DREPDGTHDGRRHAGRGSGPGRARPDQALPRGPRARRHGPRGAPARGRRAHRRERGRQVDPAQVAGRAGPAGLRHHLRARRDGPPARRRPRRLRRHRHGVPGAVPRPQRHRRREHPARLRGRGGARWPLPLEAHGGAGPGAAGQDRLDGLPARPHRQPHLRPAPDGRGREGPGAGGTHGPRAGGAARRADQRAGAGRGRDALRPGAPVAAARVGGLRVPPPRRGPGDLRPRLRPAQRPRRRRGEPRRGRRDGPPPPAHRARVDAQPLPRRRPAGGVPRGAAVGPRPADRRVRQGVLRHPRRRGAGCRRGPGLRSRGAVPRAVRSHARCARPGAARRQAAAPGLPARRRARRHRLRPVGAAHRGRGQRHVGQGEPLHGPRGHRLPRAGDRRTPRARPGGQVGDPPGHPHAVGRHEDRHALRRQPAEGRAGPLDDLRRPPPADPRPPHPGPGRGREVGGLRAHPRARDVRRRRPAAVGHARGGAGHEPPRPRDEGRAGHRLPRCSPREQARSGRDHGGDGV
ncbi:MAG: ABC transporter, ATP-binding protein (cluster 2, ribose/xylose/arabinose/galactose) / ABC transporter, ATP-binding protein (cluster 2, ribose/xylose/arabinose/galactose), partial [uncultured Blastococcus sp.]